MNIIEKFVDRKLRRLAWKYTIKNKKETESEKTKGEDKNNLKKSFQKKYKEQPEGKIENLQQRENIERQNYRERTRRIKNICYAEQEKYP